MLLNRLQLNRHLHKPLILTTGMFRELILKKEMRANFNISSYLRFGVTKFVWNSWIIVMNVSLW